MKPVYYVLYRFVLILIQLWSPPAAWFDSRFWIKTDSFGTALGAKVGMMLLRAEVHLLALLHENGEGCGHSEPVRIAAARLHCPLCQAAELGRAWKILKAPWLQPRTDKSG